MLNDSVIEELQRAATAYLEANLDKHYTYHNAEHTLEVCNAVKLFTENAILHWSTVDSQCSASSGVR